MCEECNYCDEYEPCVCTRTKWRIEEWTNRVKRFFYSKYCLVKGHKFKVKYFMKYSYKDKKVAKEECRCGLSRYVFQTNKVLTEQEVKEYLGFLFWKCLNEESKIFELLPKTPWKGNLNE